MCMGPIVVSRPPLSLMLRAARRMGAKQRRATTLGLAVRFAWSDLAWAMSVGGDAILCFGKVLDSSTMAAVAVCSSLMALGAASTRLGLPRSYAIDGKKRSEWILFSLWNWRQRINSFTFPIDSAISFRNWNLPFSFENHVKHQRWTRLTGAQLRSRFARPRLTATARRAQPDLHTLRPRIWFWLLLLLELIRVRLNFNFNYFLKNSKGLCTRTKTV